MSEPAATVAALRCPVCRAALRGSRNCGRCGGDLGLVMQVQAAAWRARRDGWRLLAEDDAEAAQAAASQSAAMVDTQSARRLHWLCTVLRRSRPAGTPVA